MFCAFLSAFSCVALLCSVKPQAECLWIGGWCVVTQGRNMSQLVVKTKWTIVHYRHSHVRFFKNIPSTLWATWHSMLCYLAASLIDSIAFCAAHKILIWGLNISFSYPRFFLSFFTLPKNKVIICYILDSRIILTPEYRRTGQIILIVNLALLCVIIYKISRRTPLFCFMSVLNKSIL